MKKTLIICGHYPFPENIGTSIRTINFANYFRKMGLVDIAFSSIIGESIVRNSIFNEQYYLEKKTELKLRERIIKWVHIFKMPIQITGYTRESEKYLHNLIKRSNYSYILVRYVINTFSLSRLHRDINKKIIIDYDDILSGSLYDFYIKSQRNAILKFKLEIARIFLKIYERRCLKFGVSIFCSIQDVKQIARNNRLKKNAFVVPNTYRNIEFEKHKFVDGFYNGHNLLFVGLLDYKPNIQGIVWFIETIFDKFKKKFPDSKLDVVGRFPGIEVKNLIKNRLGVELHADVDDLRPYYDKCRVVIVPVLTGGGTRIKILEAAFANRPVLSTPFGATGIDFDDGKNILFFDGYSSFFEKYQMCLEIKKYHSIVENAKELVLKKYSQQQFDDQMQKILNYIEQNNSRSFG